MSEPQQRAVCGPHSPRGCGAVALACRDPRKRAVLTGTVQIAGIIRMALMRATRWTKYLFFAA